MNARSRTKTAFWGGIGEKTMPIQGLEQPEIIAIEALAKSTTGMSRPAAAAKASDFGPTKRPGKDSNTDFPFESERTGKGYSN